MAKVELNGIIADLKARYNLIEREYQDECARDHMSRRATHLDGQLFILERVIEGLQDQNDDSVVDDLGDSMVEYDTDEIGYNPYTGCFDEDL